MDSAGLEREGSLEEDLEALGIGRADIRWVILTHLHRDYAGGVMDEGGALFPNVRHVVQRREVEAIDDSDYPRRQGLEWDGLQMLLAAGLVEQVDGDATQAVIFQGQDETAICLGDLLPTRYHLDPVSIPAVDDFPLDSFAAKRAELDRAGRLGAWFTLALDPEVLAVLRGPDGNVASEHR